MKPKVDPKTNKPGVNRDKRREDLKLVREYAKQLMATSNRSTTAPHNAAIDLDALNNSVKGIHNLMKIIEGGSMNAKAEAHKRLQKRLRIIYLNTSAIKNMSVQKIVSTEQDCMRQVMQVLKEYESKVHVDRGRYYLEVILKDMIIEHKHVTFNFGDFRLVIGANHTLYCHPYNNNTSQGNYYHPHMSSNSICKGTAIRPIKTCFKDGRVLDLIDHVVAILTNYNPGSPYLRLHHWTGRTCSVCGSTNVSDSCYSCGEFLCSEHANRCQQPGCGRPMCETHASSSCQMCGKPMCGRHCTRCDICNKPICNPCKTDNNACKYCEEAISFVVEGRKNLDSYLESLIKKKVIKREKVPESDGPGKLTPPIRRSQNG